LTRRNAAGLVVLAWVLSLGWLAWREYAGGRPLGAASLPWLVPPGSSFMAVMMGGGQVGVASVVVDTGETGLRVAEQMRLDPVPRIGAPSRQLTKIEAHLTRDFHLRTWDASITERLTRWYSSAAVDGDSLLTIAFGDGPLTDTVRLRLDGPVTTSGAIGLRLAARKSIQLGDTLQLRILDPADLSIRLHLLRVAGESTFVVADSVGVDSVRQRWIPVRYDTVRTWRLDENDGGLPIQRWIDPNGLPVRVATPLGVTLQRSAYELLAINYRIDRAAAPKDDRPDSIPARVAGRPVPVRDTATRTVLRLSGDGTGPVPLPPTLRGPGQSRIADTVTVIAGAADSVPPPAREVAAALAAEPLVPARSPAIRAQASAILAGEPDPARASALLIQWIAREIRDTIGDDVRLVSPVTTLATRRGDRWAKVLLFVSLARAAEFPARPVSGMLRTRQGYAYHSWAEIRTPSGWLAVDPGLGESRADAGRLRLAADRLGREADMVWRAGALRPLSLEMTDAR
jgi:hypothetical protein